MNETGSSKCCSQGHPSWEPQSSARSGQDEATRQPTAFRTGSSMAVLGGGGWGAMSTSLPFQGVSTTVLSASSVPTPLERSCASGDQWIEKRERQDAGRLAERWQRPSGGGKRPRATLSGHPGQGAHPHCGAHLLTPEAGPYPAPAGLGLRVATCSTARSPSPWLRSSPRPWCSAPARTCWPPTPGPCCAP